MGKLGRKAHLKRYSTPSFWPVKRKEYKWTVKPSPGPHPSEQCLPLSIVIRDVLGYARSMKEVKKILSDGEVKVDGRVRRDHKFPLGIMDVIEFPKINKAFRVIPHPQETLYLHEIPPSEARFKLCRIEDKTTVKKGFLELNLHDGRNVLIKVSDPRKPIEDVFKTMDVLKISLPEGGILDYLKLQQGNLAMVLGGKNIGRVGRIMEISGAVFREKRLTILEDRNKEKFSTIYLYVFIIGLEEPYISLPQGFW